MTAEDGCICHWCIRQRSLTVDFGTMKLPLSSAQMILCPTCGNKRCPKASDHRLACTGSNEPGQRGSIYGESLPMWVVTENPSDMPGMFVARLWEIRGGEDKATATCLSAPTLQQLRAHKPAGMLVIPRQRGDNAVIVECWL